MKETTLYSTNKQKILAFLLDCPEKDFYDRQISQLSKVSRSGTNFALRDLHKEGLLIREKRGRMLFYRVDLGNPLIKQLKISRSIAQFSNLLTRLRPLAIKIILYGSAAQGTNTSGSDIDIFVLTRQKDALKKILFRSRLRPKIQYVLQTPTEYAEAKKKNPVFIREIAQGITLWSRK